MNESNLIEQLRSLLQERGSKALEKARKLVLSETFDFKIIHDALHYFITEYWYDYTTPTLIFLGCEAFEGDPTCLEDLASALILINGAIDIHDDIIDLSTQKDGRRTVYGKFGKEVALLISDALFVKGFVKLAESCQGFDIEVAKKVFDTLKKGFFELGEAEVSELKLRRRFDVDPEEYLKVMYKKAADIEALMRVGAILANANSNEIEILGKYGRIVGLLSIIRDDIIDMTMWEELRHRIRYECLPIPLLYALDDPKTKTKLIKLLKKKGKRKGDLEEICRLTHKAQGFTRASSYIKKQVEEGEIIINTLGKNLPELHIILNSLAMI